MDLPAQPTAWPAYQHDVQIRDPLRVESRSCEMRKRGGMRVRPKNYFYGVDAIRFASALWVSLFHLGFWSWASSGSTPSKYLRGATTYNSAIDVSWLGWVGVEVFFIISGFVIANSANGNTAAHFLKGRILRLYPAVWICSTCTLVVVLFSGAPLVPTLQRYVHTVALLPNDTWNGWIDGVYWTLAIEISFYVLIFITLLLPRLLSLVKISVAGKRV